MPRTMVRPPRASPPLLAASVVAALAALAPSLVLAEEASGAGPAGPSGGAALWALVGAASVAYAVVLVVVVYSYLQLARLRRTVSRLEERLAEGGQGKREEGCSTSSQQTSSGS